MVEIEILLATYNGESFLSEQLESLEKQSLKKWKILARDDGSSDKTVKLLRDFKKKNPDKIEILKDDLGQLGPCQNFAELMKNSEAKYVMFCDQDDVWNKDKIEKSLKKIKELEKSNKDLPILVHTDLEVVDEKLKTINKSFMKWHGYNHKKDSLNRLLMTNIITGCTAIINRKLVEAVGDIPKQARMHDTWLGLVATCFGKIGYLDEPTMKYRIHGKNAVGNRSINLSSGFKAIKEKVTKSVSDNITQAEEFRRVYTHKLEMKDIKTINNLISLQNRNYVARRFVIIGGGYLKHGLKDNLGLLALA